MQKVQNKASKIVSVLVAAAIMVAALGMTAFAAGYEDLEAGSSYTVDASLSCYVTAMGGVEFGAPLLTNTVVTVNEDNSADITLSLTKSSVTIYSVTADTFIDPNYTVGYNDGTEWQTAEYTISNDTALNPDSEPVNYVDSITFRLPSVSETYSLAVYVNSNVMGVQFGGEGASYSSTLTVDWSSCTKIATPDETTTQSATVKYSVTGGYEVKIPSTITVDSDTNVGEYVVEANKFVVPENAYVTVTANAAGSLTNGSNSISFGNDLEAGKLAANGDTLNGTVTITGPVTAPGDYSGTIDFTISYFVGE